MSVSFMLTRSLAMTTPLAPAAVRPRPLQRTRLVGGHPRGSTRVLNQGAPVGRRGLVEGIGYR